MKDLIPDTSTIKKTQAHFASTRNACKLCAPLGASIVYKGIKGCIPLIHGSQGCSTYIRRYLISHYKEPVDIASTNFSEEATVFGGGKNFTVGMANVISQYKPEMVGISTTCLSETIGEDLPQLLHEFKKSYPNNDLPVLVHASTPSYQGSHIDGFHTTVNAVVKTIAKGGMPQDHLNLFPGFVSTQDLRNLKKLMDDFGLAYRMIPDYSETLDNPTWKEYTRIPAGGVSVNEIASSGTATASIEFGTILGQGLLTGNMDKNAKAPSAGKYLEDTFSVKNHRMRMPVGIKATDQFIDILKKYAGVEVPEELTKERGRLIDALVDGHKYVFGKKAIVYGEEDFVVGLVAFLEEIGIDTVICATGGESRRLKPEIDAVKTDPEKEILCLEGADFEDIAEIAGEYKPDIVIGHSKGYHVSRPLKIPLVRVGFPIHDRVGGQRLQHLFYTGAQDLFDRITNAIIEHTQDNSPVGYKYM